MVPSFLSALKEIKSSVAEALSREVILQIARDLNHRWRDCTLDPATTVHLFLLQVLHGNVACDHVPHLAELNVTGEAYCKARSKLPLELFRRLVDALAAALGPIIQSEGRWRGHRVWYLDGSGCSMPDTPALQEAFGQSGAQRAGCGFPVAHLMTLIHAGTGLLSRMLAAPLRTHDMAQAHQVHDALEEGDVVTADRGFCSFPHLALLASRGVFAVFRAHQRTIISFAKGRPFEPPQKNGKRRKPSKKKNRASPRRNKPLPRSRQVQWIAEGDQIVEYYRSAQRPKWMMAEAYAQLPDSIHVRELRYRVDQPGCRTREIILVTTLLDSQRYPADELAKLYGQRWEIETDLRHLKQTLNMDVLRSKTPEGIHKELAMYMVVYNLVRLIMLQAAKHQGVPVTRISFIDAQRWLCHSRGQPLRKLIVIPHRPGRAEPRVKKRRPKAYRLMGRPRAELRKALLDQDVAA
jgi:hypothetical protein